MESEQDEVFESRRLMSAVSVWDDAFDEPVFPPCLWGCLYALRLFCSADQIGRTDYLPFVLTWVSWWFWWRKDFRVFPVISHTQYSRRIRMQVLMKNVWRLCFCLRDPSFCWFIGHLHTRSECRLLIKFSSLFTISVTTFLTGICSS